MVCAKFGWTYDETLWGVSYLSLHMMLADTLSTIDTKNTKETIINGDDPSNIEAFRNQFND